MEEIFPAEEMKYGLIVVDKRELDGAKDGDISVLHFAGYENKPECPEISDLRRELSTDPKFHLTDIMEYCGIYDAPEWLVKQYREGMLSGEISEDDNVD